jgi:hypothetical protein
LSSKARPFKAVAAEPMPFSNFKHFSPSVVVATDSALNLSSTVDNFLRLNHRVHCKLKIIHQVDSVHLWINLNLQYQLKHI